MVALRKARREAAPHRKTTCDRKPQFNRNNACVTRVATAHASRRCNRRLA
jgi:hypothetical protein